MRYEKVERATGENDRGGNGYLLLFLEGLGVGLAIAAPVGPVGVLCISRTLRHGLAACRT